MKTILVLNDHSTTASHAAIFALDLAQKIRANIIVASIMLSDDVIRHEDLKLGETGSLLIHRSELLKTLFAQKKRYADFRPVIQEIELTDFTGDELHQLTNDRNIYLVVRGMDEFLPSALISINLSISMLLSNIKCPLLVVPSSWNFKAFRELVYLTDLRFCGINTVSYIADLAGEWNARVIIAHSTASGLPEIEEKDAEDIFKNEVHNHINYKNLSMRMVDKAMVPDVIKLVVHSFHADLLVFVNQHFHFNTFTKQYFKDKCALYEPVPMLIFPY
jgi:nucleotide-binding universal stress UspA family protein